MARVKKADAAEIAVAEHVAAVVAANPRGAPITLSVDNPTPLMEDALNGPPPPDPVPAPPKVKEPFCILDDQPVNSVLVMLMEQDKPMEPWLQTPNGKVDVPHDDLGWKLPLNGEIKRTGQHSFVARQRDDMLGKPNLVCTTAVEACRLFKKHFHNERD